jgi:hypothetical protein
MISPSASELGELTLSNPNRRWRTSGIGQCHQRMRSSRRWRSWYRTNQSPCSRNLRTFARHDDWLCQSFFGYWRSYTDTSSCFTPFASVRFDEKVRVLPSVDTVRTPVPTALPAFICVL